ncbi:hypothetical protein JCM19237_86 [Photobacterium aphoticum]|uniref:Uncharacterized protein n=1 Tax=Photobacterium aphoticum TaxID=754436 RepID=A0A090QZC0_9GAMM|nr:hypothetical protein JCM19237_86 [Photobacterium aphoticum]
MVTFAYLLGLLAIIGLLGYHRVNLRTFTVILALILTLGTCWMWSANTPG